MIWRMFALISTVVALAGCGNDAGCSAGGCVKGSGNVVSQARPVDDFTAIRLDSIGDLVVEQGSTDTLTVETDDNMQSLVTSKIKDAMLTLEEAGCHDCSPTKIAFRVTVKDLRRIELPSTASVQVSKLDGPTLSVDLSGTGSGTFSGRVDDLKISSSGTGSCNAAELATKTATVVVNGTGTVRVNASDTLDAKVAGTGKIRYFGSPKVTQSVTGTGSIEQETK
jgi:hypothetical protein